MSKYDARIESPAPGAVSIDPMGRMHVTVWAKGSEYPAQVFAGANSEAEATQGPLEPSSPGSDDYEGDIAVPNSPFTLFAKAQWTKASGEIETLTRDKGTYTPS